MNYKFKAIIGSIIIFSIAALFGLSSREVREAPLIGGTSDEYWVYIAPENETDTPENIVGRSQRGDVIDVISTKRGEGKFNQSKEFLIIKVKGLTKGDIKRMLEHYEEGEEQKILADRKSKLDIDRIKTDYSIEAKTRTLETAINASNITLIEKTETDLALMQARARAYVLTQPLRKLSQKIIPPARATTTNTRYVDPDAAAGGDGTTNALSGANCAYQSLNLWEAARDDFGNLAGLDTIEQVIVDSNGALHTADTTAFTVNGFTTARGNYVEIIGAEYPGAAWSDSMYRLSTDGYPVRLADEYIRVSKIQAERSVANLEGQYTFNIDSIAAGGSEYFLSYLFLRTAVSDIYYTSSLRLADTDIGTTTIWNVISQNRGIKTNNNATGGYLLVGGPLYVANSTFTGGYYGLRCFANTGNDIYYRNIIAAESSNSNYLFATGPVYDIAHCASEDASVDDKGGYNLYTNQTFSFTATSTSDFHLLSSDTGALNKGADMTATTSVFSFTDDIENETRSGTWDIGGDEYVAGGTPTPTPTPAMIPDDIIIFE